MIHVRKHGSEVADAPTNWTDTRSTHGNMDLEVADAPTNGTDARSTLRNIDLRALMHQSMGLTAPSTSANTFDRSCGLWRASSYLVESSRSSTKSGSATAR